MRSMKFKIIFVTTCLALNINGSFAGSAPLFNIKFATVDEQAQLIKGYGFDKIDEFNPVNMFTHTASKSAILEPFMHPATKNEWQKLTMGTGKKYIELAPGTEIYVKNGIHYEFKAGEDIVLTTHQGGIQKNPGISATIIHSPIPNVNQDIVTPTSNIAVKLQQPKAIVEKPQIENKRIIALKSELPTYFGAKKQLQDINVLYGLSEPYEFATSKFKVGNVLEFITQIGEFSKSGIKRISEMHYNSYGSKIDLKNLTKNGSATPYNTFSKYFDVIQPKLSRLIRLFDGYKGGFKSKENYQLSLLLFAPDAYLNNHDIDFVEDCFKESVRRFNNNFFLSSDKYVNVLSSIQKKTLVSLLGQTFWKYRYEHHISDVNFEKEINNLTTSLEKTINQNQRFNIYKSIQQLRKNEQIQMIYKEKKDVLRNTLDKLNIRLNNLKENTNVETLSVCPIHVTAFQDNKRNTSFFIGQMNSKDKEALQVEGIATQYYSALEKTSKKSNVSNSLLPDNELKEIQQSPYKDIETFCKAIQYGVNIRDINEQEVATLLNNDQLSDCVYKAIVESQSGKETSKALFTRFYIRLLEVCNVDQEKYNIATFKEKIDKMAKTVISSNELKNNPFVNIDILRLAVITEAIDLTNKGIYETDDVQNSCINLINTISSSNNELLDYIDTLVKNGINTKTEMLFRTLSNVVNKPFTINDKHLSEEEKGRINKLREKTNKSSLIMFNTRMVSKGIIDVGTVTTNEYLDLFID